MNNLDSVLIEGELEVDPQATKSEGKATTTFGVFVVRKNQRFRFHVETRGHLAEICAECLKAGRGVRVVGSLHEQNDRVWIVAEHVEFRPTKESE